MAGKDAPNAKEENTLEIARHLNSVTFANHLVTSKTIVILTLKDFFQKGIEERCREGEHYHICSRFM